MVRFRGILRTSGWRKLVIWLNGRDAFTLCDLPYPIKLYCFSVSLFFLPYNCAYLPFRIFFFLLSFVCYIACLKLTCCTSVQISMLKSIGQLELRSFILLNEYVNDIVNRLSLTCFILFSSLNHTLFKNTIQICLVVFSF